MFILSKKFLTAFLSFTLIMLIMSFPLKAGNITTISLPDQNEIVPLWQNANSVKASIDLSSSNIKLSIIINGYSGTQFQNGTVTLEKISGVNCGTIKTWTGLSSNSALFIFTDSSVVKTSGTYRLSISITATKNGVAELVTYQKEASC